MTTEEFNALPLEARRFIELHAGCLSCGNKESKLTKAYELYKAHQMTHVYQLFGGGINYLVEDKKGVLYNVREGDGPLEIREKLEIAERIHGKNPEVFISYDEKAIADLLETLPEAVVINLTPKLSDEEKAALAAEAWAERSAIIGIDTKTADYPVLQAYVAEKELTPAGKKKVDLIATIDAIAIEEDEEDL